MKRVTTGFCVAATLGCIATLGAQTSTTPTTAGQPASTMADKARDVSVTGCLSKGADGKFVLTNARADNPAGAASTTAGTTGTTAAGTTSTPTATGTTAGTATAGASTSAANANAAPMSWALMGGTDLDKHVGHKIQVTGRSAWDSAMDHGRASDASPATSTATGATGTSGTTTTASVDEMRKKMGSDQPRLDVQSIKMIAPSCS